MLQLNEKLRKNVILSYCDIALLGPRVTLTIKTNNPLNKMNCPLLDKINQEQLKNGSEEKSIKKFESNFEEYSDLFVIQNEKEYSIITITTKLPEYSIIHIANSLTNIIKDNNVENVIIISSQDMNVPSDKCVYGYNTTGKLTIGGIESLNPDIPINDPFLNSMSLMLNIKKIPTTYLTCLEKKTNRMIQLKDNKIQLMKNTLTNITGLSFTENQLKIKKEQKKNNEELLYV